MIDQLLSFFSWINQCDNLPPQCYDGTWACTCESFLIPFIFFMVVGIAIFVLMLVRVFFGTIREPERKETQSTADGSKK